MQEFLRNNDAVVQVELSEAECEGVSAILAAAGLSRPGNS